MAPMMLSVDRDALEELLKHAASAARLAGHGDKLADGLADHVDAIAHVLGEILGEPGPIAPLSERVDWLRQLVARADALASALGEMFDEVRIERSRGRRGAAVARARRGLPRAALRGLRRRVGGLAIASAGWLYPRLSGYRPELGQGVRRPAIPGLCP